MEFDVSNMRRRFLSAARQRLLLRLISGWRRRGSSLLQIGLNGGISPELFWEAGFDVTAADPLPARLEAAYAQTGPKVEYACSSPDHLPFDDGQFDYAVLVHQGLTRRSSAGLGASLSDGTPPALAEAFRVAASGVIILEWNRFSLPGVPYELCGDESASGKGKKSLSVSPWELWSMLRRFCPERRRQFRSILPLWMWTWPDCGPGEGKGMASALRNALVPLNLSPVPLPFGSLMGVRVDWVSVPLTPVGMLRSAAEKLCPSKPREELLGRKAEVSATTRFSSPERKES